MVIQPQNYKAVTVSELLEYVAARKSRVAKVKMVSPYVFATKVRRPRRRRPVEEESAAE